MSNSHNLDAPLAQNYIRARKIRVVMILAAAIVVVLPSLYLGVRVYAYHQHRRVSNRMQTAIARLAWHCPGDLTEDQWAYCIAWTWNLQGNYGMLPEYIPTAALERIVEEFEARIDAGASLATIDWLWDEYYRSAPEAYRYEQFRPTSPANQSRLEAGDHGGNPLSYWRSQYERLMASQ